MQHLLSKQLQWSKPSWHVTNDYSVNQNWNRRTKKSRTWMTAVLHEEKTLWIRRLRKEGRKAIWICEWLSMTAMTKSGSGSGGDPYGFARHLFRLTIGYHHLNWYARVFLRLRWCALRGLFSCMRSSTQMCRDMQWTAGCLHPCRYLNDASIMIFQKLFVEPLILENIEINYINQMISYCLWLMIIILRKHLAPE